MPSREHLVRLPGTRCRFYARGHCMYEEMLNPGYHGSFACTVLERLESHFEGFVNRVERFQIEDLTASMIWSRYGRKMALAEVCTRFLPDPGDTHGACLFRYDKACILRCPVCPGRCSRYQLVSNDLERGEPFRQ